MMAPKGYWGQPSGKGVIIRRPYPKVHMSKKDRLRQRAIAKDAVRRDKEAKDGQH